VHLELVSTLRSESTKKQGATIRVSASCEAAHAAGRSDVCELAAVH
jgi:hypothetical protein